MDRERRAVHRLVDIEDEIEAQCFEVIQISDNCKSRKCSHASCALFHAVVETIAPKITSATKKNIQKLRKVNNSKSIIYAYKI